MSHSQVLRKSIPFINGVHEFIDRYDGFILDLWGVIHDGKNPYPGVLKCLEKLQSEKKRVCLLSNAPRRSYTVVEKLESMGIGRHLYSEIYTSGEAVWEVLKSRSDPWHAKLGKRCFHIGPERDNSVFEEQDIELVSDAAQAQFVMNTGTHDFSDTLDRYEPDLAACMKYDLPMICANPDLVVNFGSDIVLCAGTLAHRYEEMGGTVAYHGKPYIGVYRRCFELMGIEDKNRVVAIGDSFHTDMTGAKNAEIDAVFVAGGIHAPDLDFDPANPASRPDSRKLHYLAENAACGPVGVLRYLSV